MKKTKSEKKGLKLDVNVSSLKITTITTSDTKIVDEKEYQQVIGNCIVYSNKFGRLFTAMNDQITLYKKESLHKEIERNLEKQESNVGQIKEKIEFVTLMNKKARRIDLSFSEKFIAITFSHSINIYNIEYLERGVIIL